MSITRDVSTNEQNKFVESTAVPGQPVLPVANADGTPLSVSVSASDIQIGAVEIKNATDDTRATVRDLAANDALNVAIVDGAGDQITSFGGGTQYTEGATDATITGTVSMWEDAADTVVATSATNPFPVEIIAGAGSGGTAAADDADFTAGTTSGTPAQGVYESTPTSVTDGDLGTVGITSGRRLKTSATVDAALPAGTNAIGKLAANSGVDIGDVDVTSIAAGDNNIGNVDVVTMPVVAVTQSGAWDEVGINDSGNSITVDNAQLSVVGSGTEATAMRVTIATDSTGVLSVDDNGGSLTVDGTVAVTGVATEAKQDTQVTHLATIAGDTTSIQTAVELIDDTVATLGTTTYTEAATKGLIIGAVRRDADTTLADTTNEVTALQVDAAGRLKVEAFSGETLPVSLTSTTVTGTVAVTQSGTWDEVGINDSGNSITVDNGGTFATQVDGAALTALQLIDDSIYVDDADWTADTSSHTLVGGVTQATPTANTDGDVTPLITNALRELRVAVPESDLATAATTHVKKYYTNAGAVTDGIIWSPAAGKRWFVTDLIINVSAAATVTIEDDKAGGDEAVAKFELAANSGIAHSFNTPWFSGEDAADLIVTTTAGNIYITITGYEV